MTYIFILIKNTGFAQYELQTPHSPWGEFQNLRESVPGPPETIIIMSYQISFLPLNLVKMADYFYIDMYAILYVFCFHII